eukprot:Gb_27184 [translate_table: standard]
MPDATKQSVCGRSKMEGLPSDLKVVIERQLVIRPQEPTQRQAFFLSNIDQKLAFTVQLVHFFEAQPLLPFDAIIELLIQVLRRLLVPYDFIAGRLRFESEKGRLEIDCNGVGVPLVVASTELALNDLRDITYPNPAFTQLMMLDGFQSNPRLEDAHLASFQVTRFKCGGFAVGTAGNHTLMDGVSVVHFARNLAALAQGHELAVIPYTDRTCLKARSPPQIKYDHVQLLDTNDPVLPGATAPNSYFMRRKPNILQTDSAMLKPSEKHVFRLFSVSGKTIQRLKEAAMGDGRLKRCSSFEVTVAHVWRARSIAMGLRKEDVSTVQFAVDIRSRMEPPLPKEFAGNALVSAYARASGKELEESSVCVLVEKLQEGLSRVTDEYVRSKIDWLELHDGIPCTENGFYVSAWSKLGLEGMDFGWGIRSLYAGPVVNGKVNFVIFLPHRKDEDGINVYIGLEAHRMTTFEQLMDVHPTA